MMYRPVCPRDVASGPVADGECRVGTAHHRPMALRRSVRDLTVRLCASACKQCPLETFRRRTALEQGHTISATRPDEADIRAG